MIATLGHRDFRLLWTGQLLSSLGTWLLYVAVPYRVFQLTGSPLATGLTFVAGLPATLLGPLAGVLVDRWDRRGTMIAADLGRAVALLPLLLVQRWDQVWLVYAALLAESVLAQLFDPAAQALVPGLMGRGGELASANALLSIAAAVSRLLGAPLGGVVFAVWGLPAAVLVDAGTYLASAASLGLLRWRPAGAGRQVASAATDLLGGLRHLFASPPLRGLLTITAAFVAANGAFTALLVPDIQLRLHARSDALGLLLAATGAGFVAGAPTGRALQRRLGIRTTMSLSLAGTGLAFLVWFGTARLEVAVAAAVAAGASAVIFLVGRRTQVQALTPDCLLGRASAAFLAAEAAASLAGNAAGGAAVGVVGLGPAVAAAGGVILVSGVLVHLMPGISFPAAAAQRKQ
jgi:predicted MFS family arabinose efflux permease